MFIDSRALALNHVVTGDLCIVGAGPAGITVARELIGQPFTVCLVESGDLERDPGTLSLGDGEASGDPYPSLARVRHRQYGGMSRLWDIRIRKNTLGLRYAPLDAIDFEKKEWVPYSGWPFDREHVAPYYGRAQRICRLGPFRYDPAAWESGDARHVCLDENVITSMFQFGPRDTFFHDYRVEIDGSRNVATYANANLVELETDEYGNAVRRAHLACLSGNRFTIEAKIFVLAMGAIDNARLLLLSNRRHARGLGNLHDVVGRYFMDHPLVCTGRLYPAGANVFRRMTLYDLRVVDDTPVMAKFQLSDAAMRRDRLLNMSAIVLPRDGTVPDLRVPSEATNAAKALVSSVGRRRLPDRPLDLLAIVAAHAGDVARDLYTFKIKPQKLVPDLDTGGWSLLKSFEKRFDRFEVVSQTEQSPDPENRVTLGSSFDRLGLRQPRLIFRWSEPDRTSIGSAQRLFGRAFASAGLGQLTIDRDGDRPRAMSLSTHHCMGTTRIHEDPKRGVVDSTGRVHGVSNLFMAGSSVFPTGGFANPTLTIVALAVRLADHLKVRMKG